MKNGRIYMRPSDRSVLPEVPACIAALLDKTPCGQEMIVDVQMLRKDRPSGYLHDSVEYQDDDGPEIIGEVLFFSHVLFLPALIF